MAGKPVKLQTAPVVGRRVGGGWEISSILDIQQKEKQHIQRRREISRSIEFERTRQRDLERRATMAYNVLLDHSQSPSRTPQSKSASPINQETAAQRGSLALQQKFTLFLDPAKISDLQCVYCFSSKCAPPTKPERRRSLIDVVRKARSAGLIGNDTPYGSGGNVRSDIEPIETAELLRTVGQSCIGISEAIRTTIEKILVTRDSQEIFAIVFSFTFASVFRKHLINTVGDLLSKFPAKLATLQWACRGHPGAMDVYMWCIAHAVCLAVQRTSAARDNLRYRFTQSFVTRVYSLVHTLFTGNSATVNYLVSIRNKLFAKALLHLDSAVSRPSVIGALEVLDSRGQSRKRLDCGAQTRLAIEHVSASLPFSDAGHSLSGDAEGAKACGAAQAQSSYMDGVKLPKFVSADDELNIFNSAILDPLAAREIVKTRRLKHAAIAAASNSKTASQVAASFVHFPVDSSKLRTEKFLKASTPSGTLRGTALDKEELEQQQLEMWDSALAQQIRSPRCHPNAEIIAREVFNICRNNDSAAMINSKSFRGFSGEIPMLRATDEMFFEPTVYDVAPLHEGLTMSHADHHERLSTPMHSQFHGALSRSTMNGRGSLFSAMDEMEMDKSDAIETENEKCIFQLAKYLQLTDGPLPTKRSEMQESRIDSAVNFPRLSHSSQRASEAGNVHAARAQSQPSDLKESVGDSVICKIDLNGTSTAFSSVVRRPNSHEKWMTCTHFVPRSRQRLFEAKAIAARVDREAQQYQVARDVENAKFNRKLRGLKIASQKALQELEDIRLDPQRRSEFANRMVKQGPSRDLDRETQAHLLQGTFHAESAKETANEVRAIFRRLEACWALKAGRVHR